MSVVKFRKNYSKGDSVAVLGPSGKTQHLILFKSPFFTKGKYFIQAGTTAKNARNIPLKDTVFCAVEAALS